MAVANVLVNFNDLRAADKVREASIFASINTSRPRSGWPIPLQQGIGHGERIRK